MQGLHRRNECCNRIRDNHVVVQYRLTSRNANQPALLRGGGRRSLSLRLGQLVLVLETRKLIYLQAGGGKWSR